MAKGRFERTKASTEVGTIRHQFEDWLLTQPGATTNSIYRRDVPGALRAGEYCNEKVELMWHAWQAALGVASGPAASSQTCNDKEN